MNNFLNVWFNDTLIGKLFPREKDGLLFEEVDSIELDSFSLSLPKKTESETLREVKSKAFFANLIPEGEIGERYKERYGSLYNILKVIGNDCIGALFFLEDGIEPNLEACTGIPFSKEQLATIFNGDLLSLFIENQMIQNLTGCQDKIAVKIEDDNFAHLCLAQGNSHILKCQHQVFPFLAENEAYCTNLAKVIGLEVSDSCLYYCKDIPYPAFLTERFDRIKGGRIHQEDFCQILSVPPRSKYLVTFKNCNSIFDFLSDPQEAREEFLRYVLFNCMVGNTDAHAKNFSIRFKDGSIKLSPIYDITCGVVYRLNDMSMRINGKQDFLKTKKIDFQILAKQLNLDKDFVLEEMYSMANTLQYILHDYTKEFKLHIKDYSMDDFQTEDRKSREKRRKYLKKYPTPSLLIDKVENIIFKNIDKVFQILEKEATAIDFDIQRIYDCSFSNLESSDIRP